MNPLIDALQGVIKSDAAEEQPLGDQRVYHFILMHGYFL